MKVLVPSYYPAFSCIADACRHSCCIGWEIAVDPETAKTYAAVKGDIGRRLTTHIVHDEYGGAFIRLTEKKRCPFLSESGLCDIITTLGDGALCQICTDHPRFRAFYSDRTEMGLGCSCEAAATLILSQAEPTQWIVWDSDGNEENPTADEAAFYKTRDSLIAIAQNRRLSIEDRCTRLLQSVSIHRPPLSPTTLLAVYSPLERLDPLWDTYLERLHTQSRTTDSLTVPFEQLLVYFLYRHLPDSLHDGRLAARTAFAVHSTRLLMQLCRDNTVAELAELARTYSAEIEYSDDNIEALLDLF